MATGKKEAAFSCAGCYYVGYCFHIPQAIGVSKKHPYGTRCKWEEKCLQEDMRDDEEEEE